MDWDVVIVGARVAGASLALQLGRQGRRVLLLDRATFPSDTLSSHLVVPAGVELLRRMGVLESLEASGLRRLTRLRTSIDDCIFEGPCMAPPPAYALAPPRTLLDALLVERAREQPSVTVWERTAASGLLVEEGKVVGLLAGAAGRTRDVRARVVVGADGRHSNVASWVGAREYNAIAPLRPVYYGYFEGVSPLPEAAVELHFHQRYIGFVFPMQPGLDCLALEVQPEDFAAFRIDPGGSLAARFRQLPGMAGRLREARLQGTIRGVKGVPNHFRQAFGPGWVLTGDAGHCKDPATALGIADALSQASELALALGDWLDGKDWETSLSGFESWRDQAMLPWYMATIAFAKADPTPEAALPWLRTVLSNPGLLLLLAKQMEAVVHDSTLVPERYAPVVELLADQYLSAGAIRDQEPPANLRGDVHLRGDLPPQGAGPGGASSRRTPRLRAPGLAERPARAPSS